jgi:uncharacterized membrane protein YdjX (TVP38/TMEM64 family)
VADRPYHPLLAAAHVWHPMTLRSILSWLLGLVVAGLLAAFAMCVLPFLSLASLDAHQRELIAYGGAHPVGTAALFVALYVCFAALPLPGAEVLTIVAGALFGLVEGTVLVSFASSIGATLAFLLSRWWLRDMMRRRFADKMSVLSRGLEEEGAFYLFALRLIPIMPFFLVNMLMGLTGLRAHTFFWMSQIGMLPATIAYVNAGLQLGQIRALSGILSPQMLATFAVLGLLPLTARYLLRALRGVFSRHSGG